MKPHGAIPPGFSCEDGVMTIGGRRTDTLGETPLFAYDLALVSEQISRLHKYLPTGLSIHYAMKANPHPVVVAALARWTDGIDVASAGELAVALEAGATHISFAGPGKRNVELEAAIEAGVVLNLESENEARRAFAIGEKLGKTPRLAVRVNPDFDLKGSGMRMGGGAKPFGIDAERVPALVREIVAAGAEYRGFHIFAGSQALDAAAIAETQAQTVALAAKLSDESGVAAPFVNLGGGFGVPYFPGDTPLDLAHVGEKLAETLGNRPDILAETSFAIELGRYLVAAAGVYLTRIIDKKISHGETFLITDGGLHHQLAASGNFGTVVRRNYPIAIATRFDAAPDEVTSVVGCLCTPLDRLGDQVHLPRAEVDDIVAIFMAGAYGASASPAAFLGHPAAREIVLNEL